MGTSLLLQHVPHTFFSPLPLTNTPADFVLISFTWPDDYPNSPALFSLPVTTDAGNINYRLSEDARKKVVERLNEEVRFRDEC